MRGDQLGLLLWKDYVVRKRQPVMLALVLLWPIFVFLILYTVRDNTEPEYNPTCQFPARLMPQNDFLPFLQNYVCTLGNPCEPLSEYEEVPLYKSAKLGPLLHALQPMISNETILKVAKDLPKGIQFLRSMAEVLTRPGVKEIFDRGIHIGDLFTDHDEIKELLKREIPEASPALVNNFLNVSIKLQYLVKAFGSSNMDGIVCTPESLNEFLILPNQQDLLTVSKALCALNSTLIPDLLQNLANQLDFDGLFNMINLVTAKFSSYDIFTDMQQTADSILSLKMVETYVPKDLRLRQWFPKIIPLFKNVTFKDIDLTFITRAVDLLDPIFADEPNWGIARNGFLKFNSILEIVSDLIHNETDAELPANSVFQLTNNLLDGVNKSFQSHRAESVGEILDNSWEVLQAGSKLTKVLLYDYEGDIEVGAEVLDSLRNYFPKKIMNTLSYVISLTDVVLKTVHHVATIHYESSGRVWNIAQNHTSLVRSLLTISPLAYRTVIDSFSRLDLVEDFVEVNKNAGEVFCDERMLRNIFNDYESLETESAMISELLCSDEGKQFLTKIYNSFNIKSFELIVKNMLSTFVYGVLGTPVPITTTNVTTVVRSIKQLVAYLDTSKPLQQSNWESFGPTMAWSETVKNTSARGRLDILGIHLSVAKKIGLRSLSYGTIKPSLEKMDRLAESIVENLKSEPMDWTKEVERDVPQLIDAFYLTAANRTKVLNMLEISNFTITLCQLPDSRGLINYPQGSNETRLHEEVCRITMYVEQELNFVLSPNTSLKKPLAQETFNWTAFNDKVITIYSHIDEAIHEESIDYDITERQRLKDQFAISWTKNITARDAVEVSIGVACKLGEIIDSPVLGIRFDPGWESLKSKARAISNVFQAFQDRVTIVLAKNGTTRVNLNLMPETGILEEVILRNLQDGLDDFADLITLKLPNISAIIEYRKKEKRWPCFEERSIADVLGVRNGTRKIVREIERIACNPGLFAKEWKDLLNKNIDEDHELALPFDWTEGYKKFRILVANLTELSGESSILSEGSKVSFNDVQSAIEIAIKFIRGKFTDAAVWNDILTKFDNKLYDFIVKSIYSNRTSENSNNHVVSIIANVKYVSHVIHEISAAALNILNKGPEIDALTLLGFGDQSPIKIAYSHLSSLAATIINGLSSSSMMQKITHAINNPKNAPTCSDVFAWFAAFRGNISAEDYQKLKNCTCDSDPTNFNTYSDVIMSETVHLRQMDKDYPLYAGRTILRLYELATGIKRTSKNGLTIKAPFTTEYWSNVLDNLTNELRKHPTFFETDFVVDARNSFDVAVEVIAEIFRHLRASLEKLSANEVQSDFRLWDLVEDGDVRQLLKHVDEYPEESISLAATLAWINSTTGLPIPYNELKKTMCEHHFESEFWNRTKNVQFLKIVCSFDPHQLLKSATSQEIYHLILGPDAKLKRESSLSKAVVDFIDALHNYSRSHPGTAFKSNFFNISKWKSFENDSWAIIYKAEQSWLHYYVQMPNTIQSVKHNILPLDMAVQIVTVTLDLLSGGDTWQKIRAFYEHKPEMKAALSLIEDFPNFVISVVNTFFNSNSSNSGISSLLRDEVKLCEVNKYLIEPNYMRRKGFLGSFSNLCQQIRGDQIQKQILPMDDIIFYDVSTNHVSLNETLMMVHVKRLQSLIIQTLYEGVKDFRVPMYWTSFIAGNFRDFVAEYNAMEPQTLANLTVVQLSKFVKSILEFFKDRGNFEWYGSATNLLHTLNEHLSKYETYANLTCALGKLDVTEVRNIFINKLNWPSANNKIFNSAINETLANFSMEFEKTAQYIVNITFNFVNTSNRNSLSCINELVNATHDVKPTTYFGVFRMGLALLNEYVPVIATNWRLPKLQELGKIVEITVPIWQPLSEIVKKSNVDDIDRVLPNASINVNVLDEKRILRESDLYEILVSKRSKKFLQYSDVASGFPTIENISIQLANSLDFETIGQRLPDWRHLASTKLYWLKEILNKLEKITIEAGKLLDVASIVDFDKGAFGASNSIDEIVNLLREETIDKFFEGFNELLDSVEPFVNDTVVKDDLRHSLVILESMEIFKNLGLLNTKYAIRQMFPNWPVLRLYLVKAIGLSEEVATALGEGKVNMLSVYTRERQAMSLKETVCSPEELGEILEIDKGDLTIEEISTSLCKLSSEQTQNMTIQLIKKLNFGSVIKNIMSASVKNILYNANLNEAEGTDIINNLGFAAKLASLLQDAVANVSDQFSADYLVINETVSSVPAKTMDFGEFLEETSEMLCGRPIVQDTGRIFKIISGIQENGEHFDEHELASLPSDFCRDVYKDVSRIGAGKILWAYVKPLLRGRILYAPRTTVIDRVMNEANSTFVYMENFGTVIDSLERTMSSLANLTELGGSLNDLQGILSSDLMKIAMKSFAGTSPGLNLESFDLGKLAWRIKSSKKLVETVRMLNKLMDCVLTDRVIGFTTENELEEEASRLIETNDFLAGVVFIDGSSGRSKRSFDHELPDNITYKIRMDVDSVPSTSRLKNQFWTPGPDASFVENLRYLRGFVQFQDSIDRAIIKVKTQTKEEWKTVTQQMPYPCWKFLSFQSVLYESQGLQVCFFFALMLCVGAAVRHIVWERESQNAMVMSVMGLKPWRNTFAWFITSMIELSVVAISIHIILIAGKILPHSDPFLVLFLLLDYVFASVTFCYMVSTMFSSASLAAVTTVVLYLLTYMPYIIVIAMEASVNLAVKLLLCLNMSTSFCYGCLYAVRKEVQGTGLTWDSIWEESSPGDPMSLGLVLLTIAFDGCLYAMIGYLVTRYTNSGRGLQGLRSISLWWANTRAFYGRPSYLAFENQVYFTNDVLVPSSSTHQESENDSDSLRVHDEKQIGVRFDDVRKVYQTETGECIAIDDFSIKLLEGEVTTLLGRNGAGKTTIIKMLTGMVAPTSGEIWLPNISTDKPNVGLCPQTNVLIGYLTAREHMMFYAKLKRKESGYDMNRDIKTMLTSMELNGQEDELVCRLSGGTQRRLCVCLAFLGSPNLVILDEPGAGVDPAARRRIWRLIDKHRVGRTVLLSTHHLDEADMLSDTVIVMHKGKILCSGSPLSLKLKYGKGYNVNVSFPELNSRDDVGKEKRDATKSMSRVMESLTTIVKDVIPNAVINEASESEVNVVLPFQKEPGVVNDVAEALKALEDSQGTLGFSHFNVECDTLERVFLDMCAQADGGLAYAAAQSSESLNSVNSVGFAVPTDDIDLIADEPAMQPSVFRQGKALLKKRLWHFARDWRSPLAALILPTLFVAVAMGFSLIRPPSDDQAPLVLTTELYNTHPVHFYSIDGKRDQFQRRVSLQLHDRFGDAYAGAWQTTPNDTGSCDCIDGEQVCHGIPPPFEGLIETNPGRPTLDWIVSTQQQYIDRRYGGWSLSHMAPKNETGVFTVWYNNKGHHALPAYVNALNRAILRANGVFANLTTINHPIKLSRDQLNRTSLLQHVADVGVALVLLVAFSLVGAQGAKELVRERLSEEKRILYLAGVRPLTYWTTALIWDLLVFTVSILLAVVVFEIFGLPAYVARNNLSSVCLLLFLYAWAVIPFTHLAEKVFNDSSLSNMVLFCLNTFIGVSSLATILIIDILGKTQAAKDVRNFLHQLLLIFPQYALGDGLVQISRNDITANLLERFHMKTYQPPLSWELIGPYCLYLFVIGTILFMINLTVECRVLPDFRRRKVSYSKNVEEDEDVARERTRVEKGFANDVLKTIKLRKEYKSVYGRNVAVQNLSFGIQAGECFGIFGVNGAGKSTTFKMLTTEITPTAGEVLLNDVAVGHGPLCSGDVGYCPQGDALDPFLTPHQSLTIHGEISGLKHVPRAVEVALQRFDLTKHAHERVANLSGGNKRKLAAAISVLVPSRVVLMDEATSGMDPASKDLVARAIRSIVKSQGSVLMTSHSVAECENLCTRVGVLARAGLKCIGSPQYLKHKYGEGYIVFMRFKRSTLLSTLLKATARHLPDATIASRQALAIRILVPRKRNVKLSTVFAKVKDLALELNAVDYTLTQSSLDQVLVNFSEELDNEKANDLRPQSNVDAIRMDTMRRETFTALNLLKNASGYEGNTRYRHARELRPR